ncbi:flagella biosynthesis regulator [Kluyvera sp. CHPC 1.251]|uniref:flagella biosynthesis regulator n=1 Tax=Kluyvera sp. CHPC 1.251 TaxID=2995175 RepID=UPI002FD8131E
MTQPISGMPARPPGAGPTPLSSAGEQPLNLQQRTVLERLITRLITMTSQQNAEVWAGVKHDLGLKGDTPLLARHFPAAEQNLNQRIGTAEQNLSMRQTLSQLTELLGQGNNRQAVSDFIRQQYGHTALNQLTPPQLNNVLQLLQRGQLSIPQPQQRPATDRPLLPAEYTTLNQLVSKLSAATGESSKQIWQSLIELASVKPDALYSDKAPSSSSDANKPLWQSLQEFSPVKTSELIPAKYFTSLVTLLQARLTLSTHPAPTLNVLQAALKQPLGDQEFQVLRDYGQQNWNMTPQTVLTTVQVQELLNLLFLKRIERERVAHAEALEARNIQPIYAPFAPMITSIKSLSARPGLAFVVLIVVAILLWVLL